MSKICLISGKRPLVGNNVSKSNVKREEGYLYFIDLNGDLAKKANTQQRDKESNKLYKPGTQVEK